MVFDSADIDSAVEGVVDAIWFNQGQVGVVRAKYVERERSVIHQRIIGGR